MVGRQAQRAAYRTRPDRCAAMGHPGVTYNPLQDRTWCLCGDVTYPGCPLTVHDHLACCHGPLTESTNDFEPAEPPVQASLFEEGVA